MTTILLAALIGTLIAALFDSVIVIRRRLSAIEALIKASADRSKHMEAQTTSAAYQPRGAFIAAEDDLDRTAEALRRLKADATDEARRAEMAHLRDKARSLYTPVPYSEFDA